MACHGRLLTADQAAMVYAQRGLACNSALHAAVIAFGPREETSQLLAELERRQRLSLDMSLSGPVIGEGL